ncbi:MAG: hypothetical protein AAFY39_17445, partial [Pseudomonadota bacterium]
MLDTLKSLTRAQKRNIFIVIDCALVPFALLFAFSLQMSMDGAFSLMWDYLPVLPYMLVSTAALSVWLGISSTTLNEYESSSIGQTAIFAALLAIMSTLLAAATNVPVPLTTQVVFGITYFVFSAISRAVMLQVV